MRALLLLAVSTIFASCQTGSVVRDADLRIFDQNVIGGTYVVCASALKWDGIALTLEGLDIKGAAETKAFNIGKIDYKPTQIREVNNMALAIDGLFRQMCQSTIALRRNPQALAEYVKSRDKTALEIFAVLRDMEIARNKQGADPDKAIQEQRRLLEDALKGKAGAS